MRDVHGGGAEPLLQPGDLGAHLHPQLGVQVGQRLVHQERLGAAHDRPPHGHPLALPAGEVGRLAVQVLGQVEDLGGLRRPCASIVGLVHLGQPQREAHVLPHRHVRVERVGLEHHRDVAVLGRLLVDPLAADAQLAGGDVLQPGDHVQRGGLPAAGRPDQDHELAVGDLEVDLVARPTAPSGYRLVTLVENDLGHRAQPLTAPEVSPATIRRWKNSTNTMIGMVITTAAAAIDPVGSCELRAAGEERDARPAPCASAVGGGQRDREQEVVPAEDEHEDRGGEHARARPAARSPCGTPARASPRRPWRPSPAPTGSPGRTPTACRSPAAARR